MIKLGQKYTDKVTGFSGIAICRTTYLHGCSRIGLQSKVGKDGKIPDCVYVDEQNLIDNSPAPRGGPMPDPKRMSDPR